MKNFAIVILLLLAACTSAPIHTPIQADVATWQQRAKAVTIVRDDWGAPHIYAKTDADVVFGLMRIVEGEKIKRPAPVLMPFAVQIFKC